jgi:tight adherence protein C
MHAAQWLFLLVVFAVVAGVAWLALALFGADALRRRMRRTVRAAPPGEAGAGTPDGGWIERAARAVQPLSRLSLPEEGWERSPLRTRFMNAGWRHHAAPTLYFAAKSLLALLFPALLAGAFVSGVGAGLTVLQQGFLPLLFLGATVGYYLPNFLLRRVARRRQREIFENIPDALDLLTVCVEAGLSLERAMAKVAGEIHIKSVALAQELQLVLMEMRSGFSKEKALRNLALRSGVEDIDTLVAMLIQSERFGTSMGDSLRVHADNLRGKRSQVAEEAAAKIALKLLFPLIFCVFPTLLLVLMGPAAIQIMRVLLPSITAAQ